MSQGKDYINQWGNVCKGEVHFDVEEYKAYLNKLLGIDEDRQLNQEMLIEWVQSMRP